MSKLKTEVAPNLEPSWFLLTSLGIRTITETLQSMLNPPSQRVARLFVATQPTSDVEYTNVLVTNPFLRPSALFSIDGVYFTSLYFTSFYFLLNQIVLVVMRDRNVLDFVETFWFTSRTEKATITMVNDIGPQLLDLHLDLCSTNSASFSHSICQ